MSENILSSESVQKVLLVDDHPIVRDGLAQLIGMQSDLSVCAEAANATDAILAVESAKPDVAVIDIFLEDISGIDLTKTLHDSNPDLPILVLSMHDENLYAERALRAGALGYVMKQEASRTILDAIRTVLKGYRFLSDRMSSALIGQVIDEGGQPTDKISSRLSERELEIFTMLGHGLERSEIAEKLKISRRTVETHRANIKYKLNAATANDLIQQAKAWVESDKNN